MGNFFKGVFSALVTPYNKNGAVNVELATELVEKQLTAGIEGFFLCGSTGEGLLLTNEERMLLSETAVNAVKGRAVVMVHAGHASTNESVKIARHAEKIGADAISSLPPVFFNFDIGNVICHYSAIAGATSLPFFGYLYPSLASGLGIERTDWLDKFNPPNLKGFKYTGSNLQAIKPFLKQCQKEFVIFSGSDELSFQALTLGAVGSLGTNQNIIPKAFVEIYRLFSEGNFEAAANLQMEVNELTMKLLRIGLISSQKYILELLGFSVGSARQPILELSNSQRKEIEELVENSNIILKYGLGKK